MTNKSITFLEKPLQHLGLDDWQSRLTQLCNVADTRRFDAFDLVQSGRKLRNESHCQTKWDKYNNDGRLSDRIMEMERWLVIMRTCMERTEREMEQLLIEKNSTERELERIFPIISVVAECLSMRDCRTGSELTYDEADTELKKEICVLESNQVMLRDQCQAAWEKLNRLTEIKFKLQIDIENKQNAKDIDTEQMLLTKDSPLLSFKPDALRIPKGACTYDGWLKYTQQLRDLVENELNDAYAMKESLFVCREKAKNLLSAQQERTEHTMRKRIFETQRARNELEYQSEQMKIEMDNMEQEISMLENAYLSNTKCLQLAETRLENRASRRNMEKCCDSPFDGLSAEVAQLRQTLRTLRDKIDATKTTFRALSDHLKRVECDLNNKQQSLSTDIRGLDIRDKLRVTKN